ncbi:MAG: FtsW/RodA/SpoVE family cell cycle protein, partial [Deltaproteobacteria bacterium]|nr:FtsW/RodA/SpoVE family cell cycle protein [Deltaproteobacteria bacterium]
MNSRRLGFADINWLLLAIVGLIAILGVYNLHSAAHSKDPTLYLTQMAWFGVGGLVVLIIMIPDYRLSENMAYFIYAMVCLLLVAVLFGGEMAGGARRWLRIGPIKFQPSELAKIATILCL